MRSMHLGSCGYLKRANSWVWICTNTVSPRIRNIRWFRARRHTAQRPLRRARLPPTLQERSNRAHLNSKDLPGQDGVALAKGNSVAVLYCVQSCYSVRQAQLSHSISERRIDLKECATWNFVSWARSTCEIAFGFSSG